MKSIVCEFCGKYFLTRSANKKYCSKKCHVAAGVDRKRKNEQLCFTCENACGNCNWSESFTPVPGWDAKPTVIKDRDGNIPSYKIKQCPEYIQCK